MLTDMASGAASTRNLRETYTCVNKFTYNYYRQHGKPKLETLVRNCDGCHVFLGVCRDTAPPLTRFGAMIL